METNLLLAELNAIKDNIFERPLWQRREIQPFLSKSSSENVLEPALSLILKDTQLVRNLDKDAILDYLRELINETLRLKSELQSLFLQQKVERLRSDLKQLIKPWEVIVPLSGFNLEEGIEINIGQMRIYKFNENKKERIEGRLFENQKDNPNYTETQIRENVKNVGKMFIVPMIGNIVANIKTIGTADLALERALVQTRRVLSTLIFLLLSPLHIFNKPSVYGEDYASKSRRYILLGISNFKFTGVRIGPKRDLLINSRMLNQLEENEIYMNICGILQKRDLRDIEKRLLSAIYLYSEAIGLPKPRKESEKNIPDRFEARVGEPWTLAPRFLQLFTALESICIVNEREPISQNLAERITFLIEEDTEKRIQLYDELKSLYRDRSKIVHHGYSEIDEWGFKILANITKLAITSYLQKYYELEWSSVADFAKWVKRMKFS